MAKNKMSEQTRQNILLAAREEFLEKGVEKARMDSIAARAGVNKVMLYYHFENKENILREIVNSILDEAKQAIGEIWKNVESPEQLKPETVMDRIELIVKDKIETIRLVVVETLKGDLKNISPMDVMQKFYEVFISIVKKSGMKIKNEKEAMVKIFFFQSMPLITFLLLREQFSASFGLDMQEMRSVFEKKFVDTLRATVKESVKLF